MTKRPHMPVSVQRDACLILLGLDPSEPIEWHHTPPLALRERLPDGSYNPPANDPRHIVPMGKQAHKDQTYGTSKARAGGDRFEIDKMNRITKKQEKARQRMLAKAEGKPKPKSKWPSQPFPKKRTVRRER